MLHRPNCLHMYTSQLGQTFLRQTRFEPGRLNVPSNYAQNLQVVHLP